MIIGFCWAALSNPIITLFFRHLSVTEQDIYRSLNDLAFVIIISIVLYVKISKQHRKLIKSEEEYRRLFESNPNPLWIYDEKTLKFVKVNNAAVEKYAYGRRKFLKMSIEGIGHQEYHEKLVNTDLDESELSGTYKHRKSTGETFDVSITSYPVLFNNQRCQLVMATDVSDLLEKDRQLEAAYKKIRNSNQTLLQIAWSNSHELRRPLCSIMSLVGLLKEASTKTDQEQYLELLDISSTELDEMLKHNNEKVTEIELQEVG